MHSGPLVFSGPIKCDLIFKLYSNTESPTSHISSKILGFKKNC